jgi:hypothetical protein
MPLDGTVAPAAAEPGPSPARRTCPGTLRSLCAQPGQPQTHDSFTTCRPGRAGSARISSVIMPSIRKKANDVISYRWPLTLWSVVVSHFITNWPSERRRTAVVTDAVVAVRSAKPVIDLLRSHAW